MRASNKGDLGTALKGNLSIISGRITTEISIYGWQIEVGGTADYGNISAEAITGVFDGALEAKVNYGLRIMDLEWIVNNQIQGISNNKLLLFFE